MTKDEALRLALQLVSNLQTHSWTVSDEQYVITAIKAALEAKDEPVATKNHDGVTLHLGWDDLPVGTKLYTTPPQRTWVGLTDEEASEIGQQANRFDWLTDYSEAIDFVIEATTTKLKDKNYD